jgi:hypothetical protein
LRLANVLVSSSRQWIYRVNLGVTSLAGPPTRLEPPLDGPQISASAVQYHGWYHELSGRPIIRAAYAEARFGSGFPVSRGDWI